jgi:hypothetical protein
MIDFLDRLKEAKSMFAYTERDKRTKELLSEIHNTIAGSVVWAWRWEIGDEHGYADRKEDIPANADAVTALYRHPPQADAERVALCDRIDMRLMFAKPYQDDALLQDIRAYLQRGA